MSVIKKKATKVKKAKPKKPVTKSNITRRRVTREAVVEVLANPELTSRVAQARALRISRKRFWELRREDPTIDKDALTLARQLSIESMAAGFRRLRRIVEYGNDVAAVGAIKLLAQLRGEFVEKREHSGSVDIRDPRLEGFSDEELKAAIDAFGRTRRGGRKTGGGRTTPADG